ncbi:hypothetical protein D3C77_426480 [compost metagenome]
MENKVYKLLCGALEKISSVQTELNIIAKNREEIYRISRLLPDMEGYKLMALYDDSIRNVHEAWVKLK